MDIQIKELCEKYKKNVEDINLNMKKKYFNYIPNIKNMGKISCIDDMYDILYKNKLYYNLSNYDLYIYSNIHQDIIKLCKMIFGIKYFDDNDFKYVSEHSEFNYLNPKEGERIIYNSLRKTIFQQSEFRKDVYIFEDKLKKIIEHYEIYNIRINFYEDEEYEPLVWMIIEISNK